MEKEKSKNFNKKILDKKIADLVIKLNQNTDQSNSVDKEHQRELEDALIEAIGDRYDGTTAYGLDEADAIDKISKKIDSPSEYLKNGLFNIITYLENKEARQLSFSGSRPIADHNSRLGFDDED